MALCYHNKPSINQRLKIGPSGITPDIERFGRISMTKIDLAIIAPIEALFEF